MAEKRSKKTTTILLGAPTTRRGEGLCMLSFFFFSWDKKTNQNKCTWPSVMTDAEKFQRALRDAVVGAYFYCRPIWLRKNYTAAPLLRWNSK